MYLTVLSIPTTPTTTKKMAGEAHYLLYHTLNTIRLISSLYSLIFTINNNNIIIIIFVRFRR